MQAPCPTCGSEEVEPASLGEVLSLKRTRGLKAALNFGTAVQCTVCIRCGSLSNLRADPKLLADLLR